MGSNSNRKFYDNSFIADIKIDSNNVEDIAVAGITRWKMKIIIL